ncbi:MAG: hypothetical protein IKO98_08050, partial [Bacteroidales bacterium]|nr:hypothetical protein [Bacteroidales bacterium]
MDSHKIILWTVALLPVLVLALFVYYKDKFGKEPVWMLVKAFFGGHSLVCESAEGRGIGGACGRRPYKCA